MTTVDIIVDRPNKIYKEGEIITGHVIIDCRNESRHEGILLTLEGSLTQHQSSKGVGLIETFYGSNKPVRIVHETVELSKLGKILHGKTKFAFSLKLQPEAGQTLYETYHGVFIIIQYMIKCEIRRSMLNKDLQKHVEVFLQSRPNKSSIDSDDDHHFSKSVSFAISPNTLQNVRDKSKVPDFKIIGKLYKTDLGLHQPVVGELVIKHCDIEIKSIDLQLIRIETRGSVEGFARDATEVQNIQIGVGDVCREINIPIYMILPRLFTCPTLITDHFRIEFELNLLILFEDNHIVKECFPIRLLRM